MSTYLLYINIYLYIIQNICILWHKYLYVRLDRSIVGRVFALHAAKLGPIPASHMVPYSPPEVIPRHRLKVSHEYCIV